MWESIKIGQRWNWGLIPIKNYIGTKHAVNCLSCVPRLILIKNYIGTKPGKTLSNHMKSLMPIINTF